MPQSFTFQQPKSQRNVLVIILVTSLILFLGVAAIFFIFGNDSPATPFAFFGWVGLIMLAIFRMVRSELLTFTMTLEEDGFVVERHQTGTKTKHRWGDVSDFKVGDYAVKTVGKAYLWIWIKDNGPVYYVEDDGSDQERAAQFEGFVGEWTRHYSPAT